MQRIQLCGPSLWPLRLRSTTTSGTGRPSTSPPISPRRYKREGSERTRKLRVPEEGRRWREGEERGGDSNVYHLTVQECSGGQRVRVASHVVRGLGEGGLAPQAQRGHPQDVEA